MVKRKASKSTKRRSKATGAGGYGSPAANVANARARKPKERQKMMETAPGLETP